MSIGFVRTLATASALFALAACGSSGGGSSTPRTVPVVEETPVAFDASQNQDKCPNGGESVVSFADANRNGVKDKGENSAKNYYCSGTLAFKQDYTAIVEVSETPQSSDPIVERTLTLNFNLSHLPINTVSFDYAVAESANADNATAGEDFIATTGSVVFERGQTKKQVIITIKHDTTRESHETFLVKITNQVNTDLTDITVRINDDDENPTVQFTEAVSVITESSSPTANNTGTLTVKLSEQLDADMTVPFILSSEKVSDNFEVAQNGVDFSVNPGAGVTFPVGSSDKCNKDDTLEVLSENKGCIVFSAGETEKTIEFTTIDDNIIEGREKVNIQLQVVNTLSNGENANHALSIADAPVLIKSNFRNSCALSEDGQLKCWGDNRYSQHGTLTLLPVGSLPQSMQGNNLDAQFSTLNGSKQIVDQFALGFLHACAVINGGKLQCWGYNGSGQLGYDKNNTNIQLSSLTQTLNADNTLVVESVDLDGDVSHVTAGVSHTCAVLTSGAVKCWGSNRLGQLGLGDTDNRGDGLPKGANDESPKEMGENLPSIKLGETGVKQLVSGADHNCVLFDSASLKCWGDNQYGQLGLGDNSDTKRQIGDGTDEMDDKLKSVELGSGKTALSVGAGDRHTCALLNDNTVKCWGNNSFGQLGQGNKDAIGDKAEQMGDQLNAVDLGDNFTVSELYVGGFHNCAVSTDKKVKCWGRNRFGQLGYEDTNDRGDEEGEMGNALVTLSFPEGYELAANSLSLGQNYTCAIFTNKAVKCWGLSDRGQLGLENTESISDGLVINPSYDSSAKVEEDHADGDCQPAKQRIPVSCEGVSAELSDPELVTEIF